MKIDLCGNWILSSRKYKDIEAKVPGSVLGALLNHNLVPDPYYRDNEAKVREYLYDDCIFRRTFTLPRECLGKTNRLMINGIDTVADIYINGQCIASVRDMHLRKRVLLDNSLLREHNEIEVKITSPYRYINEYDDKGKFITFAETEPKSPCIRKANYMFGWDWGPNLADMGIHKDIYILSGNIGYLKDMKHEYAFNEDGSVIVRVQTDYEKDGDGTLTAALSCESDGTYLKNEAPLQEKNEFTFALHAPKLWYPAGFGEQPLYHLDFCVRTEQGETKEYRYRIGVRKIEIDDREDEYGRNFAVYVNGKKVFIKGSNYIPQDNILERVTPERTRRLLNLVRDFNHNAVRVWGGGYYPEDEFYDICDELGLLVSQDIMMACAGYNADDENFVSLLREETADAVKRFRHHACVYMINGNNECEDQIMSVGEAYMQRYAKLSTEVIDPTVKKETNIYYLPSSPSSGKLFDCPQDMNRLDMHYWEVWHRLKPFDAYKEIYPRMLSEFGCQSMPPYDTILGYAREDELDLFSPVMAHHQKNHTCNDKILHYAQELYGKPKDFRDLVYLSMLAQAEGIKTCVEHLRRNKPRCNGALYWQLDDCWPGQSWSSVDYNFGLKALHYYSRRFYAPYLISIDDCGKTVKINVSNDTAERGEYRVIYKYMNFDGEVLDVKAVSVFVDEASCSDVLEIATPFVSNGADKLIYAELRDARGNFLSENFYQKSKDKDVKYAVPKLTVEKIDERSFSVVSDTYTKGVYIEPHDNEAVLSDNYFNLLKGQKKIITAAVPLNFDILEITTLNQSRKVR